MKILFKIVNEEHSPSQKVVRHLLTVTDSTTKEFRKKGLNDWYIPDNKDYDEFSRKHPVNGKLLNQSDKIEQWINGAGQWKLPTHPLFSLTDINFLMLTALRIYNIFFWNSSPKEKLSRTKLMVYTLVSRQPKPSMLKAKGNLIF